MSNFFQIPDVPILNDAIFINLGYMTGSSTALQRNYAYRIAENQVNQEIGTYLVPTTVTDVMTPSPLNTILELGVGMINSINSVVLYDRHANNVDQLISGTSRIHDPYYGYFSIDRSVNDVSVCQSCFGGSMGIYKAELNITAGYATGTTVDSPDILLALCMASEIVLTQMYDRGMGFEYWSFQKTVQIGRTITSISDRFLLDTSFGHSPMALFIRNLLKPYKIYKAGKF